ncbi:MAG: cytochrome ubiquinol oxidase subunit I, partial [Desulfobacteraceae bacterium]
GDIFGSLLAIEATVAFFLESTLIGIWIFGWKKISAKAHAFVMWLVAIGGSLSAVWILIANAWMQHPVGYTIRNGRAELTDFIAVITQKFAVLTILHTLSAAYVLSAFFVMSISAWHLLKKNNIEFFSKSFRIGLVMGLLSTVFVVVEGDFHAVDVAKVQPAKLAAMETHWETQTRAPVFLFSWPDEENERNFIEIGRIPGVLSFLAFHDINAPVQGLKEFPKDERPPVAITALAFKIMVGLGFLFIGLMITGWFLRNKLSEKPWFLKLMVISLPLPYIAIECGWILAEVGRQPWIVYGLLKTSDAASPISAGQVLTTLIGFIVLYGLLGIAGFYMIFKNALKGPKDLTH